VKHLLVAALLAVCAGCAAGSSAEEVDGEGAGAALSAAATPDPTFAQWAQIATLAGAPVNRHGEATVVGVRGMGRDGTTHATSAHHAFDDVVVVLKPDHTIVKISMSTHPFETGGVAGVPDVDGDGVEDVGMIRPGVYRAVGRGNARLVGGHSAFDVTTAAGSGKLPGTRDTNHDGIFSDAEAAASDKRGDKVTSVLFHDANDGAPPAVGCQVFDAPGIVALIAAVGGPTSSFDYALVGSDDAAGVE